MVQNPPDSDVSYAQGPGTRVTPLVDAATIAIDATDGKRFSVTLGGDHMLGNPSHPPADGKGILVIVNPSTHTLSYDTEYNWGDMGAPTLTASKDNYLGFIYSAGANEWRGVAASTGY